MASSSSTTLNGGLSPLAYDFRGSRVATPVESDNPFSDGTQSPTKATSISRTLLSQYDSFSQADSSLKTGSARDSTYLIPTPIAENRKERRFHPITLSLPLAIGTPLLMIILAIALEIGIGLSQKNNGFSVPKKNVIPLASQQFLLSIVPTLFVIPVGFGYRELDWYVRLYQPYIVLTKGNAKAEESILLDYVSLGSLFSLINSVKYRHRVVIWSTLTALATYTLQPLAGSMFQIQQLSESQSTTATSLRVIGLSPDVSDLSAFAASAGFAEAAVFNQLPDPPFVHNGWATAMFECPTNYLNGSVIVNTTSIQTKPNCANPNGTPTLISVDQGASFNITSTSVDGCTSSALASNTSVSTQQYGVVATGCNSDASLNVSQQPVMFWYFHHKSDGTPEAKTVFCAPTIQAYNVMVTLDLDDNSLTDVTGLNTNVPSNNVTGGVLAGKAFNGVVFDLSAIQDTFVLARALAINNGVPGAVFRFASQPPNDLSSTFDKPNDFLDFTVQVYTQHLTLSAKSIYFLPQNSTLNAEVTSLAPRLTVNPVPGHFLAFFLFFIGSVGIFLHIIHRRQRKHLYLATPPGTIAATTALTSHSGFGELLMPYDDEKTLERKLGGLRFHLDRRTGAVIASPGPPSDTYDALAGDKQDRKASRFSTTSTKAAGRDEAMMSLLGKHRKRKSEMPETHISESSSHAAYEAAAASSAYPPANLRDTYAYKTPYEP